MKSIGVVSAYMLNFSTNFSSGEVLDVNFSNSCTLCLCDKLFYWKKKK